MGEPGAGRTVLGLRNLKQECVIFIYIEPWHTLDGLAVRGHCAAVPESPVQCCGAQDDGEAWGALADQDGQLHQQRDDGGRGQPTGLRLAVVTCRG